MLASFKLMRKSLFLIIFTKIKKLFLLKKYYIKAPTKEIQQKVLEIRFFKRYQQMTVEELENIVSQVGIKRGIREGRLNMGVTDFLLQGENSLTDGVPLPFSSLFNEYIGLDDDLILDQDDYILENKFNDWINKYNGNMKASDFATLGFIEGMCKLYTAQKKLGDKAESFNRDLKIIAMATCIMIQMSAMILNQKNILKKKDEKVIVPSGKWNVILTGAMMKAMAQEMAEVTKVRNEVNKAYSQKINEVKTNE